MVTEMKLGETEEVSIDRVRPYWRNPRRVTAEAVDMVRASIEEYGYQQPIVVDTDYVIIVGHTRYAALRKMGKETATVMIAADLSPKAVKEYRVIDNRVGEYTSWEFDLLVEELTAAENDLMHNFFPEVDFGDAILEAEADAVSGPTPVEEQSSEWDNVDREVEFTCPSCFHGWTKEVTREELLSGVIKSD